MADCSDNSGYRFGSGTYDRAVRTPRGTLQKQGCGSSREGYHEQRAAFLLQETRAAQTVETTVKSKVRARRLWSFKAAFHTRFAAVNT